MPFPQLQGLPMSYSQRYHLLNKVRTCHRSNFDNSVGSLLEITGCFFVRCSSGASRGHRPNGIPHER
ncbi:unnamed protein product [Cylicocyclus nassatus]|uniref:Uncharacterized protein n=1 Tax=Cylicocyclus nassatus TaxID=53992 RepID=A0AA36GJX0_CYLNA|nr:unnamed protein product [Cylicocyclus nassatus]